MKYFAILLHFYQPPTQDLAITNLILESCYLPLLRSFKKISNFQITLNISGSVIEQLEKLEATEFFTLVNDLLDEGKIELSSSLMYHSLMPLTPQTTIDRSISENQKILKKHFPKAEIHGFFPPELAMNQKSLKLVGSPKNFSYTIVSESAVSPQSVQSIYHFHDTTVFCANTVLVNLFRAYPEKLQLSHILNSAKSTADDELFVIPCDAEVFGHHYSEREQVLKELLSSKNVKCISFHTAQTQFVNHAKKLEKITLSSWQSFGDLRLWTNNVMQKKYLKLAKFASELAVGSASTGALKLLDQGWSSCFLYWLSNWPWWHPDMVVNGATCLIKSVRGNHSLSNQEKQKAEKLFHSLLLDVWEYHWSEKVEQNYRAFETAQLKNQTHLRNIKV